jgi:hypothetical protein
VVSIVFEREDNTERFFVSGAAGDDDVVVEASAG